MKKFRVGVLGATGMVGQRFVSLLEGHPWYDTVVLAASGRSAGRSYAAVMEHRWQIQTEIPQNVREIIVLDAVENFEEIISKVDFVFCAVDMPHEQIKQLEERYAKAEIPVISNNSVFRSTPDVPMIIPEINPEHSSVIKTQRARLGTQRGFIAVKSNCSLQSYVPAIHPLMEFGVEKVLACTYQAISGAGKTFDTWPEMNDNVIPYIGGEEEKSEQEPLKIWGDVKNGLIVPARSPLITSQCIRVPVSDGHMAAVFVSFKEKPTIQQIKERWSNFSGVPQLYKLPSAPHPFIWYFEEQSRPQTKLDRSLENGMAVSVGRLRPDSQYDYKFVCLSHNTIRGAAGGAILMAELLTYLGYIS